MLGGQLRLLDALLLQPIYSGLESTHRMEVRPPFSGVNMRVISDIHLGSKLCKNKLINRFLDEYDGPLIVNGDLVDHWKMHKWKRSHLVTLDRFRKRPDTSFIAGNHEVSTEVATQITGLVWVPATIIDGRFFVCHGHHWDKWVGRWPLVEDFIDLVYNSLNEKTAKLAKHAFKKAIKCISKDALKTNYDAVICGHTHWHTNIGRYWNTGCWTESPGTWVEIKDGVVSLGSYK
jgi:UDP-2,3-diacylglucosamine pyrophosphatase LpxH